MPAPVHEFEHMFMANLVCYRDQTNHVFPVAITCGTSEPNDLEFLLETIQDLGHIMQDGFQYDDKTIRATLH